MTLASLNAASAADAEAAMLACCASRSFAAAMVAGRPYQSADALLAAISSTFTTLTWDDVLEAMRSHPRIGERVSGQSAVEQSGVTDSSRAALADANRAYEQRFGYVFLVCASGLSGQDMLAQLRERLNHDPATERAVATAELHMITVKRAAGLVAAP
ncbi:MAG TPA: 2-oxo-4-hydroxy-4-carboxy-5-ureidoimidazoline decarboxylase [Trebonia sp.]|nr:2-oxo-4-hydroxy-4-carboxy-5-ureidoimidazoline decarboxylase [Trebonia sp.]